MFFFRMEIILWNWVLAVIREMQIPLVYKSNQKRPDFLSGHSFHSGISHSYVEKHTIILLIKYDLFLDNEESNIAANKFA